MRSSVSSLQSGLRTNPWVSRQPIVFAVDDRSVQFNWGSLPPGRVTLSSQFGPTAARDHEGGAGALTLVGLPQDTQVPVRIALDDRLIATEIVRTDRSLPGAELDRFFTMSDLHLNRFQFGLRGGMRDRSGHEVPFPERSVTAAVAEARSWGARAMFLKGDIVDHSDEDGWAIAARCVSPQAVGIDSYYLGGNHEVNEWAEVESTAAAARVGIELVDGVRSVARAGVAVIMVNTAIALHHSGRIAHHTGAVSEAVAEARSAGALCMLLLHHQIQGSLVPTYFPPGIPRAEAEPFLAEIQRAGPVHLVTSGHTHRHRARRIQGVVCTEVGSPKDYPGTWGGYVIAEGGIRQIVHRVEEPAVVRWTQYSRHAALGAWGVWSPGSLDQRCLTVHR